MKTEDILKILLEENKKQIKSEAAAWARLLKQITESRLRYLSGLETLSRYVWRKNEHHDP